MLVHACSKMSFAACVLMLMRAAECLAALHAFGTIHGDVKPDNFLVRVEEGSDEPLSVKVRDSSAAGWWQCIPCTARLPCCVTRQTYPAPCACLPQVSDFGLSRRAEFGDACFCPPMCGTFEYLAPELKHGVLYADGICRALVRLCECAGDVNAWLAGCLKPA